MNIPDRVTARVIQKITVDETTDCWISGYSVGSHGYPQIGWQENGKRQATLCHRVMWKHLIGPIPDGMTVDHEKCRNRKCVNPSHLRLLSNLENARRNRGRDWPLGECINGHSNDHFMPAYSGGPMVCRICYLDNKNKSQRRIRAAAREK